MCLFVMYMYSKKSTQEKNSAKKKKKKKAQGDLKPLYLANKE